jgi:hypothetical protein
MLCTTFAFDDISYRVKLLSSEVPNDSDDMPRFARRDLLLGRDCGWNRLARICLRGPRLPSLAGEQTHANEEEFGDGFS